MRKSILAGIMVAGLSFTLGITLVNAQGRGHGAGGGNQGASAPTWKGSNPPGFSQGRKTGWVNGQPRGWSKGHKTGWNGGNVPPGLR